MLTWTALPRGQHGRMLWSPASLSRHSRDTRTKALWCCAVPDLTSTLTYAVTAVSFSPDGSLIATASADRSVKILDAHALSQPTARFSRLGVEFDHAVALGFSPDSTRLVIVTAEHKDLLVYSLQPTLPDSAALVNLKLEAKIEKTHTGRVVSVCVGPQAKFLLTVSDDAQIKAWVGGKEAATVKTGQVRHYQGALSADSKRLAVASFSADVKIFEVVTNKASGVFEELRPLCALKGHKAGVQSIAWSALNSGLLATLSLDRTVRVWDLDVRHRDGEDAKCVGTVVIVDDFPTLSADSGPALVALSPSTAFVAVAHATVVATYAVQSASQQWLIRAAHTESVTSLAWAPADDRLFATGSADRHAHIWRL
eukprot:TRINITY_DN2500_c0_g1_i1.p1 TRINITY_DN2500_c0_g1~~TRINITY_DN2500_c0_g1_i1.p1  ORF type:complete len:369 (+),score=73.26 TRINITY_DN2500_c0_g1_i1:252-1358(+)